MRLLLASAFSGDEYREVLPEGLPLGNYDFMYTLPGKSYGWYHGLQDELKRQFGVTAHFETRVTHVRLLMTLPSATIKPPECSVFVSRSKAFVSQRNFPFFASTATM